MRTLLVLLYLIASTISVAQAKITVIRNDPGGLLTEFVDNFRALRDSGDQVVIDGYCYSACTLVTRLVPPSRVCVTKNAVFGFHSAFEVIDNRDVYTRKGTEYMWNMYPPKVRKLIRAGGWDGRSPHPNLLLVPGTAIYKTCT